MGRPRGDSLGEKGQAYGRVSQRWVHENLYNEYIYNNFEVPRKITSIPPKQATGFFFSAVGGIGGSGLERFIGGCSRSTNSCFRVFFME